ncbi:MAG: hypothetical protein GY739_16870 [Mesoflavibacter sp.]|nr:hypothetical protein [Mesoflavibacter sp.]
MKIENTKNGKVINVTFKEWKDNYLSNGNYKNYKIIDYFSVVELHRLKNDGTASMTFMEKQNALETQIQFPNEFRIKELIFNGYNKWLIKENSQGFFSKILYRIKDIAIPNAIPKEKKQPFSMYEILSLVLMALAVIVPLIIWLYPKK